MGPFTPGTAREIADPQAEMERLAAARKPREQLLCHEAFMVDHDGASFFVWIKVSAKHALQAGAAVVTHGNERGVPCRHLACRAMQAMCRVCAAGCTI